VSIAVVSRRPSVADELIEAFLEATEDLSTREAASAAGISHGTVAKWRAGDRSPVIAATRRKLRAYLEKPRRPAEESPEDAVYDPGEVPDDRKPIGEEEIVQMPQVVRHLKTFDGMPDAGMLKLAAVRVWGEILSMSGGWPPWYIALRERVERGEL
jgi:transcriptional regulator with XRE-family HTH domain